jgi:hypothetical protein
MAHFSHLITLALKTPSSTKYILCSSSLISRTPTLWPRYSFSVTMNENPILSFYRSFDSKPDYKGRRLSNILQWSNQQLEFCHDYIQVLFPLPEISPILPYAPLLTQEVVEAFRSHDRGTDLRRNMCHSFERMLTFYGFVLRNGKIEWADDYKKRFDTWVRFGHNHLRVTRILRCLRLVGLEDMAALYFEALQRVNNSPEYKGLCGNTSMGFWTRAAQWPLWNPPDKPEGTIGEGLGYLVVKESAKSSSANKK